MSRPALPSDRVSRNAPLSDASKARPTGLARISESDSAIECSCGGWAKVHPRAKVRGDAAQRHIDKRHGGRAIWL